LIACKNGEIVRANTLGENISMSRLVRARMNAKELSAFLEREFPQMNSQGHRFLIEKTDSRTVWVRMKYSESSLRPGGTISGPAMFALADIAMYAAVLSRIGPEPLAVTTNLNINFLRKPQPGDMIAEATVLKLGKRLAFGAIALRGEGSDELAAHATSTYSIPGA
jgi:uncharacterized protein (TIGR00369 family)